MKNSILIISLLLFALACATYKNGKKKLVDTRDKEQYKVVMIGNQIWMAENLRFNAEGSWNYENKDSIGKVMGRLYNWQAAVKACPAGWHLPSDEEWKTLEKFLGMPEDECNGTHYMRGSKQSLLLKEGGSTGFNAQLAGYKHGYDGGFYNIGQYGVFWTDTEQTKDSLYWTHSFTTSDQLLRKETYKEYGNPVRCLKD